MRGDPDPIMSNDSPDGVMRRIEEADDGFITIAGMPYGRDDEPRTGYVRATERHEVASRDGTLKRFVHPLLGTLTLDCQILTSERNITERLVVFTAMPGSEDADRLALLSVVGSQRFPSGAALEA
jgi:MmyB-like transcription regulator ligand binding domain